MTYFTTDSQILHRGLNFVTVCIILFAAFMGYQVVRQLLWIEGRHSTRC